MVKQDPVELESMVRKFNLKDSRVPIDSMLEDKGKRGSLRWLNSPVCVGWKSVVGLTLVCCPWPHCIQLTLSSRQLQHHMDLNSNLLRPCLDLLEAKFISSLSVWMQKEGRGCDSRYYQCKLGFLTAAAAALWDFTHHSHNLEKTRNWMASSIPRRE